jgi:TonB family protein
VETDVQVVSQVKPGIPPQAKMMSNATKKKGIFSVRVRVYVDANGRAAKTVIDQDSGVKWGFEDAAEKAAQDSNYKPATKNGKNVPGWITIPYKFTL